MEDGENELSLCLGNILITPLLPISCSEVPPRHRRSVSRSSVVSSSSSAIEIPPSSEDEDEAPRKKRTTQTFDNDDFTVPVFTDQDFDIELDSPPPQPLKRKKMVVHDSEKDDPKIGEDKDQPVVCVSIRILSVLLWLVQKSEGADWKACSTAWS